MAEYQEREIRQENGIFDYLNKFCTNRSAFKVLYINLHDLGENARSQQNKKAIVEISGNVTLDKLPELAKTGIDVISSSSIITRAGTLDLGFDYL